jgi:hypothetical protein
MHPLSLVVQTEQRQTPGVRSKYRALGVHGVSCDSQPHAAMPFYVQSRYGCVLENLPLSPLHDFCQSC